MAKPRTLQGYTNAYTLDCERVLVTLLRGLGPWKSSVCLIGGLTPRYLVRARPPDVPPHASTQDVDIVIDLQISPTPTPITRSRTTFTDSGSSALPTTRVRSSPGAGRPGPSAAP